MLVKAAMIEYLLASRGERVTLVGDPDTTIEHICRYQHQQAKENTLSVSNAPSKAKAPRRKGSAILHWEDANGEDDSLFDLIEATYEVVRQIDAWETALLHALLSGCTFSELLNLGRKLFSCPIAYFDRNLIVLAASDDYWNDVWGVSQTAKESSHTQLPASRAAELVEDIDYLRAAEEQQGFYYENAWHRIYYGINTFDDGEYLARLVFALPEGASALHQGEELLAQRFHELLCDLHMRFTVNADVTSSRNNALHAMAKSAILDGNVSHSKMVETLSSYGWSIDDNYIVVRLVFFEGVHWDSVSAYLCEVLEREMSASCAFSSDNQIVWLANLSKSAIRKETPDQTLERFIKSLVTVLRDYACKAGIGNPFRDFGQARARYLETALALEFGQIRNPHHWYHRFGDYTLDYLLAKCCEDLSPSQVCHPALARLIEHDRVHGTEFARTLVRYLRCSQNTTHAARELFIHRTSFMRRMDQIKALVNIDFSDSNTVLHLLLSARLMEID